jgi:dUTP pyrophosphatase
LQERKVKNNTNQPNLLYTGTQNLEYKTEGSAGIDLASSEDVLVQHQKAILVPTGIKVVIPKGYEGQLRLRSSMYNRGVIMPNAPGTIDSDYRGEIKIPLRNVLPYSDVAIFKGERIAQLILSKVDQLHPVCIPPEEYDMWDTERSDGGFGSTGN